MRLIDANALYTLISEWESVVREEVINTKADLPTFVANNMRLNEITRIKHLVADAPTVDAEPVRHGKWIRVNDEFSQCSSCKYPVYASWSESKYCPNCGCVMVGEEQ